MTCRKFKVKEVKPELVFEFEEELPISACNGFISLPIEQALEIKREYEESQRPKASK
jgi:hypothetical protein